MNTIQVNSLPIGEVIADIAAAFQTSYSENCKEYYLKIPISIGQGHIRGINFEGGLGLIQYHCTFKEDLEIKYVVNTVHPLKFLYVQNGTAKHRFAEDTTLHSIEQYQHAIVASNGNNGHIVHFQAEKETCLNSLELDRKVFKKNISCELEEIDSQLAQVFEDIQAHKAFYYKGNYSLHISHLFTEMQNFEKSGIVRKIFLEGIAYQMLCREILQYQDSLLENNSQRLLRCSEVKLIQEAAEIIQAEINSLDTIETLSRRVGLNVNKLQNGFQNLYNLTINGYVQETRMNLAKNLLMNTEFSIGEIVDKVGLSSKSYFSKIFKMTFHLSPSQFRKQYLKHS